MGIQTDVSLPAKRRAEAMARLTVLRPHLKDDVPSARAAEASGVPVRTARRELVRFQKYGVAELARANRADRGLLRLPNDLVRMMGGMALARPPPSAAAIHRRLADLACEPGWPVPAAWTVWAIVAGLDPAMRMLAHEGSAAHRDRYELIHLHRAERPSALWQCDHIELDILVAAPSRRPLRP